MTFILDNTFRYDTSDISDTVDAAGRARVVQPYIDFSTEFPNDKVPDLWDEVISGNATSTHDTTISGVIMETTTSSGDKVVRQTKQQFRYQPGASTVINTAFVFGSGVTNNRKRVGQFDVDDGFFLEQDGNTLYVVRRSSTSGTVTDEKVSQNNWNIDRLDGTGPSGLTLDITKIQDVVFGYEWYGAGIAKYGFRIKGQTRWVHQFQGGNKLDAPFVGKPVLPIRYEIENTDTTSSNSSVKQFGSAATREGGSELVGFPRTFNTGTTPTTLGKSSFTPLLSIRLKSSRLASQVEPLGLQVVNVSKELILWELVLNPSLTNASFVSSSRAVEGDVSATDATGGIVLASGYAQEQGSSPLNFNDINVRLGSDIGQVADILTIRAITLGNNIDSFASIDYKELA